MIATRRAFHIALSLAATASLAAQAERPRQAVDMNQHKICRISDQIGTRLGRVRTCRTQAEWDQTTRENSQVLDRIQRGATPCSPWSRC